MEKLGSWYQSEAFKDNLQGYEENQVEDRILRLEEKVEEVVKWINARSSRGGSMTQNEK